MERENSKGNNKKSYSIYVMGILSERIKEQEVLEKLHEKEDLQSLNIRKDRKGKEGNIAVLSSEQKNQYRQHLEKLIKQNNTQQRN